MRITFEGVHGEIDSLPGCSQIAVSHAVFLPEAQRNKGLGRAAHEQRLLWMTLQGYDVALCTIDSKNLTQRNILLTSGWRNVWSFVSQKTGHQVLVYMRNLK